MKVAFVYPHLYFDDPQTSLSDSLGIITYEMAHRLARSCEVTVYAQRGLRQSASEIHEGVHYRRLIVTVDQLMTLPGRFDRLGLRDPGRPFYTSPWYYASYGLQVARDLRRRGCDIVHMFTFPQFARVIRAYNPDAKIVLHMEDHSLTQRDQALLDRHLKGIDLILGCSDYVTAGIRKRFPELADRCRTVFNGVDLEAFGKTEAGGGRASGSGRRLLYVGRISPEKGLHVLLEAFEVVAPHYADAELTIVGPEAVAPKEFVDPFGSDPKFDDMRSFYSRRGGYLAHLKRSRSAKSADRVKFVGKDPYKRIRERYQQADVFVVPSLWHEPFGMPAIEAMAAGVALIATRGGAFTEIVDHESTGLLVERGDAAALANAIIRLLSDDGLRAVMGAAGRDRARELFSWDRIVGQLLGLYEELLSTR
jgi:glycosyltransferase involved in cell wall biosynthesis